MAQWGEKRTFFAGDTSITLLPDVTTDCFEPIKPTSPIHDVLLLDVDGENRAAAEALAAAIREEYKGRPYSDWTAPIP